MLKQNLQHPRAICCASSLSRIQLFATPWTVAYWVPLSWRFSRQEYLSGLPCSPPGNLPSPEIEPRSLALQADSLTGPFLSSVLHGTNIFSLYYDSSWCAWRELPALPIAPQKWSQFLPLILPATVLNPQSFSSNNIPVNSEFKLGLRTINDIPPIFLTPKISSQITFLNLNY